MKKRWRKAGFILVALLVILSGCSKKDTGTTVDQDEKTMASKEETKTETETETESKDNQDVGMKSESGSAAAPEQKGPVTFNVYYSDDDASELVKESVEIDEISPENVWKVVVEKASLSGDIKINSVKELEKDGEKVLDVDFSQEFAEYMSKMGSTGEYMTLGSVCNTFLDAYGCKKIHITVEGSVLSTGHNEYPGYMGFYK